MTQELPKQYEPGTIEAKIYQEWLDERCFAAAPAKGQDSYVIMMPLPNVTGALHMGHAMDNVMQDLLVRWHRMQGENALWMAGTDHAGIATQAVVEKRLFELEGKTRHDVGRDELVRRIWEWKEKYGSRIVSQLQTMGCSCDWDRQRFTMDAVCARAVRHTFFNMFRDGLIYRGDRLVNWDCHLQTAVADDEIEHITIDGNFWHLRYPVIDPQPGEPEFVIVATTRPETMLGDTAVACHPDPAGRLEELIEEARAKLTSASDKERSGFEEALATLEARKASHLGGLEQLRDMARAGRKVRLPLLDREIALICDDWAKPELGSGCVKITPGHDPNDHEVWKRHPDIGLINILNDDGSINANGGAYVKLDRFDARKKVVADLDAIGLLERVEERKTEVGHSDRSKTPIEPYMSKQWFVRMGDVEGGVLCGRGTSLEFRTPGLAQAAIDAVSQDWQSPTGRRLEFHPDDRYARTYRSWLAEKRDWCISRQLWWGHQIPIWKMRVASSDLEAKRAELAAWIDRDDVWVRASLPDGTTFDLNDQDANALATSSEIDVLICLQDKPIDQEIGDSIEALGYQRDPDVLDTWFSSGLWPHSTLGWPNPETAQVEPGQSSLAASGDQPDCLEYFYPGSCLVTGRDIITLWVARMALMGLYNLGDLPFTDSFIHANILDGKGVRMSKSKGNGIDPVDIIERYGADAMRYVLCELQTGSQDIRLPVSAVSPFTGNMIDLAKAKHGSTMFTYICPETKKEFDVLGTMDDVPPAKLMSDRFDVGRNFCNKLWNTGRFAFMNLEGTTFESRSLAELPIEDRWILSRAAQATREVTAQLEEYSPAAAVSIARDFFWSNVCDWYLELLKPRMRDEAATPLARQVLATVFDSVLRLLHPFTPFITEELWAKFGELAPKRGIESELSGTQGKLIRASWPEFPAEWIDSEVEDQLAFAQEIIRNIREVRAQYQASGPLNVSVRATGASVNALEATAHLVKNLAQLEEYTISADATRASDAATKVVRDIELFVAGVVDLEAERARLEKSREQLSKRIEGARKKLSNPNFVERAQPDVVERERDRLAEFESQLASVKASLTDLESNAGEA